MCCAAGATTPGVMVRSSWPSSTVSPTATCTSATAPSTSLETGCSIFIDSITMRSLPAETALPTAACTAMTVPKSGDVTRYSFSPIDIVLPMSLGRYDSGELLQPECGTVVCAEFAAGHPHIGNVYFLRLFLYHAGFFETGVLPVANSNVSRPLPIRTRAIGEAT